MSNNLLKNPLASTSSTKIQAALRRHSRHRVENPYINGASALLYFERLTNAGGTTMPSAESM